MQIQDVVEVRFHGRGGQGAVVASKTLAVACFYEGLSVQSFPQFGVERRGAPVMAFLRASKAKILIHSAIYSPTHVIVLEKSLLDYIDVTKGLKEGGKILINSRDEKFKLDTNRFKIAYIDANTVAVRHHLGTKTAPIINTAILGAFARFSEIASIEATCRAIEHVIPVKIDENKKAAIDAYNEIVILK
jgi:pyruvate ferredoxin oxidoreductase gamma subunit/2-oxoisovalerate ferredoxin oxidoreductase gamma subunit